MEKQLDSMPKTTMQPTTPLLKVVSSCNFHEEEVLKKHFLLELQSTLDLEQLLVIFFRYLNTIVPCRGLDYQHQEMGIFLRQGSRARHSAEYRLNIGRDALGTIRFNRRNAFAERELKQLETLLGALVLPVRNALYYRQALEAASIDPLTGLKNRRSYADNLEREISRARRENQPLGLMVIDVDRFKRINDEIGHLAGDQVLAQVAEALRRSVRRSDMVFRFAGDEFVLLLPNLKPGSISALKSRIRRVLQQMDWAHGDHPIEVSLSIGVAVLEEEMDGEALFKAADLNMLCEKAEKHGKS
ncbi:GGDEF domain-containing protein [Thiolapillus sp.]